VSCSKPIVGSEDSGRTLGGELVPTEAELARRDGREYVEGRGVTLEGHGGGRKRKQGAKRVCAGA
jgi:hypothetical protein